MADTGAQLERERAGRPRAAAAAAAAALLTIAGGLYSATTLRDAPQSGLFQGLQEAAKPGAIGTQPSLRIPLYEFFDERFSQLLLAALLSAAGALGMGYALLFVARAAQARAEKFPRAGVPLPVIGAALMALSLLAVALGTNSTVKAVLDTDRTVQGVSDVKASGLLVGGQLAEVAGRFALGGGWILIALHAMRTGLLTRFMGVLGIFSGVLIVLPVVGTPLPVVQAFWLLALAVILLDRWPGGVPPAWRTGKAEPWPTPQRAAREAPQRRSRKGAEPDDEPAATERPSLTKTTAAHPSSKKKKRKRRT